MKRNIIYILRRALLLLCMMTCVSLAWAGDKVGNSEELKQAIESSVSQIDLTADITLTETIEIEINRTLTLDLAGHSIIANSARAFHIKSGSVTIMSTDNPGKISVVGTIASNSSVIRVGDPAKNVFEAALYIEKNVTIETDLCYGVTVFGRNAGETLSVEGDIHTKVSPAISGNGNADLSETTITVGEKAVLTTTNDVVIYHPQKGNLTVNGSLTGDGGIEIKGGTLTVGQTAEITATGTPSHPSANNNGTSTSGYAIAIVENGEYAGVSAVSISKEATIHGTIAVVKDSDNTTTQGVTFDDKGIQMLVKVTDSDKSFGQYLTLEEAFRTAPVGCTITLLDDCSLSSTIETTQNYTLDLDGHTITSDGHRAFHIKSGDVTIKSTATGGTITVPTIDNNDLSVIRVGSNDTADASLTVDKGVTIAANECYGITIFGKNETEVLNVAGNVTTKNRPAISGNGTNGLASTTITVVSTAKITTADEVAIYHPQAGTLTVYGKVTGSTGIEIKGGELAVNSSAEITCTGTPTHTPNPDGTSTRGYAIAIVENNGGYGNGEGVKKVAIDKGAKIDGPIAQLQDSPIEGFNPTYDGDAVSSKVAAIGDDKYFTLKDAVDIVPASGTVKLLGNLALSQTVVMDKFKTYMLDLAGFTLTGNNCAALQIAGGHVTIDNSGAEAKSITVSGTVTQPLAAILMGSNEGESRNVSLTINNKVIVDGGTITNGILLAGNKTRESLIVNGTVQSTDHNAILGSKDADKGGTTIQIASGGIAQSTNAVAIYHPQRGELIVDGTVSGSGAIEMKDGNLTVKETAQITASGTKAHTANENAPSTNGYAIALVENASFTGVGKVNIPDAAGITGVIAYLVDSKNINVAEPVYTGDIYMVAQTANTEGLGEKYAKLTDAIDAAITDGEVKMLDDIAISTPLTIGKAITLNMDDYSLIGNLTAGAEPASNVTVIVSTNATIKNGGITSNNDGIRGIDITSGTVNLQQMTVDTKGEGMKVSDGEVTADAKSSFTSTASNTIALTGGTLTLSGKVYNTSTTADSNNAISGTGTAALNVENTVVISSAKGNGIDWKSTGDLTIAGGKIMGAEAVYANNGNVTINGGTFTATGHALEVAGGTPAVNGGTFICGAGKEYKPIVSSITGFVKGEYFNKAIDQSLCAEGYMVSTNPKNNGMYYLIDQIVINDGTIWSVPTEEFKIHTAKYVRSSGMGANGTKFGTLCLPFSYSATQTGMTFYSVNRIEEDMLYLNRIDAATNPTIEAGTPVVFQFSSATSTFTIESENATISNADAGASLNLVGTFTKKVLDDKSTPKANDVYFLNSDAFHQAKESLTIPAFRAYIQFPASAGGGARADVLNIFIEDEADDLNFVMQESAEEMIFDLQGNRQDTLKPGINIVKTMDGRTIKVYVNK